MIATDKFSNRRIDEIECLRGIAILFTLFHHIPLSLFVVPTPFLFELYSKFTFWGGVDLFFAISGFVIMRSFSSQLEQEADSFWTKAKQFWIRRCFRIFPPAWIWLGIFLIFTKFVNSSGAFGSFEQNLKDAVPAILQYANIYGVYSESVGPNDIYWSLSIEEQFYILLPIFIFVFRQKLPWILLLAAVTQFFMVRSEWSLGWAIRTDALIWGVLIALFAQSSLYRKIEPVRLKGHAIAGLVLVLLCVSGIAYFPAKLNHFGFGTGIVAVLSAILVWMASYDRCYIFNWVFLRKLLIWFGTRSFSLYLIHILAYRFSHEFFYQLSPTGYRAVSADSYILVAIAFPLLLICGELSFRFIEKPFRNLGRRLATSS